VALGSGRFAAFLLAIPRAGASGAGRRAWPAASAAIGPAAGENIMEKLLNQLVDKLRKAHNERLVSVVLYGSAASSDYQPRFSDINVLCVLTEIAPHELAAGAGDLAMVDALAGNSALMLFGRTRAG